MSTVARVAAAVNTVVRPVVASAWGQRLVGRALTVVTYRGRRSGRVVSIPVGYVRSGNEIHIGAELPDRKVWWRNFTGDGHPLSIRLDGVDRTGHAIASRDGAGRVRITVRLDGE